MEPPPDPIRAPAATGRLAGQLIAWTRFVAIVPAVGLIVGATALILVGAVELLTTTATLLPGGPGAPATKALLVEFILIADVFLLAIVLYIVGLGLFELFVFQNLPLPPWLVIRDLDDLKNRLVAVIIVVLAVLFLSWAIDIRDGQELFWFGAGTAVVIGTLAYYLRGTHGHSGEH
jgi:uncharacterized membrane protein YqhA